MSTRSTTYSTPVVIDGIMRSNRSMSNPAWTTPVKINDSYTGVSDIKTVVSVNTVGFHKLLECGELLPYNSFDIQRITKTWEPGYYEAFNPRSSSFKTGWDRGPSGYSSSKLFLLPDGTPGPSVLNAMVNSATADARSAVMDVLTFLAEYRQMQVMFKTTADRLGAYGMRAAKRAWRFKDRNSAFAQLWLEYRYGWLPLCYSLDDALHALTMEKRKYAYGNSNQTVLFTDSVTRDTSNSTSDTFETETVTAEHTVRGWAACDINSPFGEWGLDPIKTTWELVPFSFVFDWFIDVGSWIDAVSPFQPGNLKSSGVSVKSVVERSSELMSTWKAPATSVGGLTSPQKVREKVERYTRYYQEPTIPGWNPRITPTRIIDAVALALATRTRIFKMLIR